MATLRMSQRHGGDAGRSSFKSYWGQETPGRSRHTKVVVRDLYREPAQIREEPSCSRAPASMFRGNDGWNHAVPARQKRDLSGVGVPIDGNTVGRGARSKILDPGSDEMQGRWLGLQAPGVFLSNGETGSDADP